jgi:opacity protein-like surface antigen
VLTIERVLGRTAEVEFSLASSLQYYSVSARAGAAGGLDAHHYNYVVVNQAVLAPPIGGPFDGLSPGTAAVSGTRKLAMDLYVFDLGGKAALATGWFSLSCAAGPALYLSDAESRHNESGTWNLIPGTGDPGSYRLAERDSAQRACIGAFVSLGAGVRLTDSLALAVEYRYDAVDRTAGTSSAAVDLDGQSCMLKLVYSF